MLRCCVAQGVVRAQKAATASAPPCWHPPCCQTQPPAALAARSCCVASAAPCTVQHRQCLQCIECPRTASWPFFACCNHHNLMGSTNILPMADQHTAVAAHLKESVFWTVLGGAAGAAAAAGAAGLAGGGVLALCLRPSGMENSAMGCSGRTRGTSTMKWPLRSSWMMSPFCSVLTLGSPRAAVSHLCKAHSLPSLLWQLMCDLAFRMPC